MSSEDPPSAVGAHSRDDLRRSYVEAWRKRTSGLPLTPLEALIADVLDLHPEYHALVRDARTAQGFEPSAGVPQQNPFLHMGLHLAVREQLAIDRPPGIRALAHSLSARLGAVHEAEHVLMDSLAETLWEAQRSGRNPDENRYLELARRRTQG